MQIKLAEVVEAIDDTDVDTQYWYYIPEERIIIRDDDSIKDKEVIALPSHKQIDDYGTMRNFIEEKTDGEAREWLEESIKGAGAFRRFRMTLDRFGLTEQWYDYLEDVHENIAIDWCDYYGIEYLEDEPFKAKDETPSVEKDFRISPKHNYRFITIDKDNSYGLAYLTRDFRKTLSRFKNEISQCDVDDAVEEINYYLDRKYPVYALSDNGRYIGYIVCRVDDDVVWLESIYVRPEYRRKGVGTILFDKAQNVAEEYGNSTLYLYVHPNNDTMLDFLKNKGYDVLNLIEIRKPYKDETVDTEYTIGDHTYRY